MKKSILFLSFLALLSCDKSKQEMTNTTDDNITESNVHLVEMNSQQISEIITPQLGVDLVCMKFLFSKKKWRNSMVKK